MIEKTEKLSRKQKINNNKKKFKYKKTCTEEI